MMEMLKIPPLILIMENVIVSMSLKVLSVKVRLQLFFLFVLYKDAYLIKLCQ